MSKEELLDHLHELSDELGKTPSRMEMRWNGEYEPSHYEEEFGTWESALARAGLEKDGRGNEPIPRDELLRELERIGEEIHDPPRTKDMDEHGQYSSVTYINRFGSWRSAVETAGFEPYQRGGQPTPKEDLVADLQRLDDQCEGRVTGSIIEEESQFSKSAFLEQFGTLRSARKEAGLDPGPKHEQRIITDQELIEAISRVAVQVGETPTLDQVESNTEYSHNSFTSHFGSYSNALEEAGFDPADNRHPPVDNDELLDELQRLAEELERTPTKEDMDEYGKYTVGSYVYNFESWVDAQEEAGLEPNRKGANLDRETLVEELDRLSDEIGTVPRVRDMREYGKFSVSPYLREFDSWKSALETAGLDANHIKTKIPDDEILGDIERVAEKIGAEPSTVDMREHGRFSVSSYCKRFDSWKNALERAEIDY